MHRGRRGHRDTSADVTLLELFFVFFFASMRCVVICTMWFGSDLSDGKLSGSFQVSVSLKTFLYRRLRRLARQDCNSGFLLTVFYAPFSDYHGEPTMAVFPFNSASRQSTPHRPRCAKTRPQSAMHRMLAPRSIFPQLALHHSPMPTRIRVTLPHLHPPFVRLLKIEAHLRKYIV